jgi:phage terminase large subunit
MRAVGEDVIFNRWQLYNDQDLPEESAADWILYGGDFGYTNDPTALVKVMKFANNIYISLLLYETGLLNSDVARIMKANNWNQHLSIWDSADGLKSVNELRIEGINAAGAKKGTGSVSFGIQYMKKFNLFIHEDSKELISEIQSYKWAKARNGEYKRNTLKQRVPVENQSDHALDAARYAITYYTQGLENELS